MLESFEAKILRLSTRNTQNNHADIPIQLREFLQSPTTHDMIYEYWDKNDEFTSSRIQDVGLISPGNGSVERSNSRGQKLYDNGSRHSNSGFLSSKKSLRSVNKRLPKFYNDRMDSSAWDAYKSGLESERRTNQIDISAMFNLDDIEEPEGANLDARIDDAVWNVDPENKAIITTERLYISTNTIKIQTISINKI